MVKDEELDEMINAVSWCCNNSGIVVTDILITLADKEGTDSWEE